MIDYGYKPRSTTVAAGRLVRDWNYEVRIPPDDGSRVDFRFHLPRGTLSRRMSAFELLTILGDHIPAITPFMRSSHNRRVRLEWLLLVNRIRTMTPADLDEHHGWCCSHVRHEENDIVRIRLGGVCDGPSPTWLAMGGAK